MRNKNDARQVAEVTCYTVQFFSNLCRNGFARQVAEKIVQCNSALKEKPTVSLQLQYGLKQPPIRTCAVRLFTRVWCAMVWTSNGFCAQTKLDSRNDVWGMTHTLFSVHRKFIISIQCPLVQSVLLRTHLYIRVTSHKSDVTSVTSHKCDVTEE